jgi:hypothetical protein
MKFDKTLNGVLSIRSRDLLRGENPVDRVLDGRQQRDDDAAQRVRPQRKLI